MPSVQEKLALQLIQILFCDVLIIVKLQFSLSRCTFCLKGDIGCALPYMPILKTAAFVVIKHCGVISVVSCSCSPAEVGCGVAISEMATRWGVVPEGLCVLPVGLLFF